MLLSLKMPLSNEVEMLPLSVRVHENFILNAGEVSTVYDAYLQGNVYIIAPPTPSMYDQILVYLHDQPQPPHTTGIQVRYLGIGLAAIGIRWGTYLAALLNPDAPLHPILLLKQNALQPQDISYITDSEMMRLNLEVSSNFARLGSIYQENASAFYDLLQRAYHYLPMPSKSTRPNRELESNLVYAYLESSIRGYLYQHPDAVQELMTMGILSDSLDPTNLQWKSIENLPADRIIGNFLANFAWRNTVIEDYHAGRSEPNAPLLPNQRRFTARDERKLFHELCSNAAVVVRQIERLFNRERLTDHPLDKYVAHYPASAGALYNSQWKWFYSYPRSWSLTENSSTIEL
jgi:hypothetical protein